MDAKCRSPPDKPLTRPFVQLNNKVGVNVLVGVCTVGDVEDEGCAFPAVSMQHISDKIKVVDSAIVWLKSSVSGVI